MKKMRRRIRRKRRRERFFLFKKKKQKVIGHYLYYSFKNIKCILLFLYSVICMRKYSIRKNKIG